MPTYQPYLDFTAQSKAVAALMGLYAQLDRDSTASPQTMPIVVFMAFAIEAYLNSIGARHLAFWDELERLPWRQKVAILHTNAGADPDWGKEPLQFASEVFRLRDKLAHGKPERVLGPVCATTSEADKHLSSLHLQPDWYRGITNEWIVSAKDRFRVLMGYLGQLYGLHPSDHLSSASGGFLTDDGVES